MTFYSIHGGTIEDTSFNSPQEISSTILFPESCPILLEWRLSHGSPKNKSRTVPWKSHPLKKCTLQCNNKLWSKICHKWITIECQGKRKLGDHSPANFSAERLTSLQNVPWEQKQIVLTSMVTYLPPYFRSFSLLSIKGSWGLKAWHFWQWYKWLRWFLSW